MKCKAFSDTGVIDKEINIWLELLGPKYRVSHVVSNKYRTIVFVELV